jgi:phage terminase large subunit-like protein
MRPWQKREIAKIYGNKHGTRRAIISFGRKNGKTALVACLLLLHLAGPEAEKNTQLYSAAQSRDQAAVVFGLASKMVRLHPKLRDFIGIVESGKILYCESIGTRYQALSADATTAFGKSPIFLVHDELGQVKGPRSSLYEALETACSAHDNPLSVVISTQAPTDGDLLSILIDDALAGSDPRVVVSLYTAPMEDDPFLVKTIKKANPAYGDFQNRDEVKAMARDAKRMPAREADYRNLVLNQRVEARSPFVSIGVWKNNGAAPVEDFAGYPVYCGLDLSATTDLTALVALAKVDDYLDVQPTFWLPREGLSHKSKADRVPYDLWHQQGHLDTTPGATIEYEWIAYRLRELFDKWDIRKVAFDRWNWKFLRPWLQQAGFEEWELEQTFVPFGQGYASMSPALRELETALLEKKLRHGLHPVLTMCAANAVCASDPAGNRKLRKDQSSGRIDGMVALAMAVAAASDDEEDYADGRLVVL